MEIKNKVIPEICSREYTPCVKVKRLISPTETLGDDGWCDSWDDGMAEVPDYNLRGRHHIKAFTLIEVLVVVLIIGILAAVALPQYQKSVLNAHLTQLQILHRAYTTAQQVYYLANGIYADNLDELDISIPEYTADKRLWCYMSGNNSTCILYNAHNRSKPIASLLEEINSKSTYCCAYYSTNYIATSWCQKLVNSTNVFSSATDDYRCYKKGY